MEKKRYISISYIYIRFNYIVFSGINAPMRFFIFIFKHCKWSRVLYISRLLCFCWVTLMGCETARRKKEERYTWQESSEEENIEHFRFSMPRMPNTEACWHWWSWRWAPSILLLVELHDVCCSQHRWECKRARPRIEIAAI